MPSLVYSGTNSPEIYVAVCSIQFIILLYTNPNLYLNTKCLLFFKHHRTTLPHPKSLAKYQTLKGYRPIPSAYCPMTVPCTPAPLPTIYYLSDRRV